MNIGESIRTLSLCLVACLLSISFLVFFLNSANSYAQEGCYDVQVKLSDKMANRFKKQINPQDTYNELSKEYLSYFSDDRFEEAKEVADALIVLSSCIFGLKRAISLAGARSIITSLWSVPSDETVQLMTTFYSLWTDGKTKAKALQEAKLSMRSKNANPYYWGAFTLSGARE